MCTKYISFVKQVIVSDVSGSLPPLPPLDSPVVTYTKNQQIKTNGLQKFATINKLARKKPIVFSIATKVTKHSVTEYTLVFEWKT